MNEPKRSFVSLPLVRIGLGLALSIITLVLALRTVSIQDILAAFSNADWGLVGLALLGIAINTLAKAFRWKTMMGPQGSQVSLLKSLLALMAGQALNNAYPWRVGDLARAYLVGNSGLGSAFVLSTILLEKLFDLLAYALLFVALLLFIPLPAWVNDSVYVLIVSLLFGFALVFFLAVKPEWTIRAAEKLLGWASERFPVITRFRSLELLRSGLSGLQVMRRKADLLKVFFWLLVIWGTAILTNQAALMALKISVPLSASVLVLVMLQAGISLPSAPGRIGIFEYICVLALSVYQVAQPLAISFGFLLHAVVMLPMTILGLASLALLSNNNKEKWPVHI